MAQPVFVRRRTVGEAEIDELGHVNNVVWVQLVVELAQAHSDAEGLRFRDYVRLGGFLVVRRHEIEYRLPALPGDAVVEETWVAHMHGARTTRRSRFWREPDRALLLEATTDWAYVDARTQRPRRLAPEILDRFTVVSEAPPPPFEPSD